MAPRALGLREVWWTSKYFFSNTGKKKYSPVFSIWKKGFNQSYGKINFRKNASELTVGFLVLVGWQKRCDQQSSASPKWNVCKVVKISQWTVTSYRPWLFHFPGWPEDNLSSVIQQIFKQKENEIEIKQWRKINSNILVVMGLKKLYFGSGHRPMVCFLRAIWKHIHLDFARKFYLFKI